MLTPGATSRSHRSPSATHAAPAARPAAPAARPPHLTRGSGPQGRLPACRTPPASRREPLTAGHREEARPPAAGGSRPQSLPTAAEASRGNPRRASPRDGAGERRLMETPGTGGPAGTLRRGPAGCPPHLGKFQQSGEALSPAVRGTGGGGLRGALFPTGAGVAALRRLATGQCRGGGTREKPRPPPPPGRRRALGAGDALAAGGECQTRPRSLTGDTGDEGENHEQLHPPAVDGGQQAQQRPLAHHARRQRHGGSGTGHPTGLARARPPTARRGAAPPCPTAREPPAQAQRRPPAPPPRPPRGRRMRGPLAPRCFGVCRRRGRAAGPDGAAGRRGVGAPRPPFATGDERLAGGCPEGARLPQNAPAEKQGRPRPRPGLAFQGAAAVSAACHLPPRRGDRRGHTHRQDVCHAVRCALKAPLAVSRVCFPNLHAPLCYRK